MFTYLLIIILIAWILRAQLKRLAYWMMDKEPDNRPRRRASFDERPLSTPAETPGYQKLVESEIWDHFTRDFVFIMPRYGLYKGKKIPFDDITDEMMSDPSFVRPGELGQWLQRDPDQ